MGPPNKLPVVRVNICGARARAPYRRGPKDFRLRLAGHSSTHETGQPDGGPCNGAQAVDRICLVGRAQTKVPWWLFALRPFGQTSGVAAQECGASRTPGLLVVSDFLSSPHSPPCCPCPTAPSIAVLLSFTQHE